MPVSVVVGGQFGSEGKGKVALELVRRDPSIRAIVRPGGTNSGHTGYRGPNRKIVLRQLPAGCIDGNALVVFPPGSYIDVSLLKRELAQLGLDPLRVKIDPHAHVIRPAHIRWEKDSGLMGSISSTGSGTGAAVLSRFGRYWRGLPKGIQAKEVDELSTFISDTSHLLHHLICQGQRVLVEGTQGFGLSAFHSDSWPKATSRDTTAAGFLSECGIAPSRVDEVVVVTRTFPIRVAGDSGPLTGETTWSKIASESGAKRCLQEYTSVTQKIRRVGIFDPALVKKACLVNGVTKLVLNHLDYVDAGIYGSAQLSEKALAFVEWVQGEVGRPVDFVGTAENTLVQMAHAYT